MPPLKKELQDIVDELEFENDAEKAEFEKFLAKEKIAAKIEAGYMKNKDYTTKTAAVADARKKLEQEQTKWNEEQDYVVGTMSKYKEDMEKRLNSALAEVSKSKLYGAALETKLQKIAAQYGEDPEDLLSDVKDMRGTKEPEKKDTPNYDDEEFKKRYIPREEFTNSANAFFGFAPMIRDLDREYHKLYGKEYDGSMQELVKEATVEVNARRARGQQIDLYGYIREKLDFEGQKTRNVETDKVKSAEETKKWQEDQRKEIEQQVRSEYLAANPGASRQQPESTENWRQNLSAGARKEKQQPDARTNTARDTFKRQSEFHRAFEERAAKTNAA